MAALDVMDWLFGLLWCGSAAPAAEMCWEKCSSGVHPHRRSQASECGAAETIVLRGWMCRWIYRQLISTRTEKQNTKQKDEQTMIHTVWKYSVQKKKRSTKVYSIAWILPEIRSLHWWRNFDCLLYITTEHKSFVLCLDIQQAIEMILTAALAYEHAL